MCTGSSDSGELLTSDLVLSESQKAALRALQRAQVSQPPPQPLYQAPNQQRADEDEQSS